MRRLLLALAIFAFTGVGTASASSAPQNTSPPTISVSLDVSRSIVIYRGAVTLSGSVSNAQAGQPVTIMEHRFPFGRSAQVRELATVKTAADGSFSVLARPVIRTLYTAKVGNTRSDAVPVNVRPLIRLTHAGARHRFLVRAAAARSFAGKYVVLQRWNRRTHVWVGVRRIYFRSAVAGISPTVVSCATFRAHFGRVLIRVFMPLRQTVPGYISGSSNAVTS